MTHPNDSVSGQPYAPPTCCCYGAAYGSAEHRVLRPDCPIHGARETPPWLHDVDVPVPTYPGRARAGYGGPNNLSWPEAPVQNADGNWSHLPPPIQRTPLRPDGSIDTDRITVPDGGDGGGGNRRTLVAALVVVAVLVVAAAYCVTRAAVGRPLFGGLL